MRLGAAAFLLVTSVVAFADESAHELRRADPAEPDLSLWSQSKPAESDNLRFRVATENVEHRLVVKGSVQSTRPTPVRIGYGACFSHNVRVRLYRTPGRSPPAVWENPSELCTMQLIIEIISAQRSASPRQLQGEISGHGLPDSVPAGTYYATAQIRLAEPRMISEEIAAGAIVVSH
jgi:hypothetical protein